MNETLAAVATSKAAAQTLPLTGLRVVVTGDVPGLTRTQAQAAVAALGGKALGSVSAKTDLLVTGQGAGLSKTAKAVQHGVPVLSADDFAALVADPGSWDGAPLGTPLAAEQTPSDAAGRALGTAHAAQDSGAEPDPGAGAGAGATLSARVPDHAVAQAVLYPDGVREVRLLCRCGHRWTSQDVHASTKGCPQDPQGYPRPGWREPVTVASVSRPR